MRVMISGVPARMLSQVEAEIRAALALHPDTAELNVVVTKLPSGAWMTYVFDAATGIEVSLPDLAQRLAAIPNVFR